MNIIDPKALAPYFESVLDGYVTKRDGRLIADLWKEDWQMFSEAADAIAITSAVLGDAIANAPHVARHSETAPSSDSWVRLRKELQGENRFFPVNAPDKELFRVLMENLVRKNFPLRFYRARIMMGAKAYSLNEMGAPPADVASDGRANPIGIPYLYLADDIGTAIAEIKPSKGALITVATFSVAGGRDLSLVDLTSPRSTISPFRVTQSVADVRASMAFLEILGEELSVPTQPHRATRDYLASQYLCELIKVSGYDGVIYRSSLGPGRNFALFDVNSSVSDGQRGVYRVTDIEVSTEPVFG